MPLGKPLTTPYESLWHHYRYKSTNCNNGVTNFVFNDDNKDSECCWIDSRNGQGVGGDIRSQPWSVKLDQTYKVTSV